MPKLVTKPCEGKCGTILEDVYPTRRFCNACQIKKEVRRHQTHHNKGRYKHTQGDHHENNKQF